jgi:hypothetical protein
MMSKQGKSHQPKLKINTATESGPIQQLPFLGMARFNFGRQIMGKYGFSRRMNPLQPLTFLNNFRKKGRNHDYPGDRNFMFADYYNIHITLNHLTTSIPSLTGSPSIQAGMENGNDPIQLFNHYQPAQIVNRQLLLNRLARLFRSGAIAPGPAAYNQNLSLVKYLAVLQHQKHFFGVPDLSMDSNQPNIHQRPGAGNSLVYRLKMAYQLAGRKAGYYPGSFQELNKEIAPLGDFIRYQSWMGNHRQFFGERTKTASRDQSSNFHPAHFDLNRRGMYVPLTGRQSSLVLRNLMKASHPDWVASGISSVSSYGYNDDPGQTIGSTEATGNSQENRGSHRGEYRIDYSRLNFGNFVYGQPVPDRLVALIRETERLLGSNTASVPFVPMQTRIIFLNPVTPRSLYQNGSSSGNMIIHRILQRNRTQSSERWEQGSAKSAIRLLTQQTQPRLKIKVTSGNIPGNDSRDGQLTTMRRPRLMDLPSLGEESITLAKAVSEQTAGEIVAGMGREMADKKGQSVYETPPGKQLGINTGIEIVQSQMELLWKGVQRRDRTLYHIFRKYENPAESSGRVNLLQLEQSHAALKLRAVANWKGLDRLSAASIQPLDNLESRRNQRMPGIRRGVVDYSNPLTAEPPNLIFKIQRKPVPDQEPESETKQPPKMDEAVMASQITEKVTQNLARELSGSQLNMIANKVYQIIEKRLTIEKDRRGING